jgi:hypothetical protein
MTHAMVVYESMFGNTKAVAEAVAAGLREHVPTDVVEVAAAPTRLDEGEGLLLVVGGPTHAFSMSREDSRRAARDEATEGVVSTGVGLREWLERLQHAEGVRTATFDTRMKKAFLPGSAARAAQRRLLRRGFGSLAEAESFWVEGMQGPLRDGELERARAWGARLGVAALGR